MKMDFESIQIKKNFVAVRTVGCVPARMLWKGFQHWTGGLTK